MKIAVFGCGYVGLTAAIAFAQAGNNVIAVDSDSTRVAKLRRRVLPFFEPSLKDIMRRNITKKRLRFSDSAKEGIEFADIVVCAVGTPPRLLSKADLSYVLKVAAAFGKYGRDGQAFINKSTVPVGTSEQIRKRISKAARVPFKFDVVSNPEFLRQGLAYRDFVKPDRIVVGLEGDARRARSLIKKLYAPQLKKKVPLLFTDIRSAEIIKYASNAFLATKVSFVNEIANFCEAAGGDTKEVLKGVCADKRIGNEFMNPGIGFGGSCLPKDVNALISIGKKYGFQFEQLRATKKINDTQPLKFASKVIKEMAPIKGKRVAIWGVTFKPGTDDLRAAPSVKIVEKLLRAKAKVSVYDPAGLEKFKEIFKGRVTYCGNKNSVLVHADCLLLLTEWPEFLRPDKKIMRSLLKDGRIFDGRNVL